MNFAHKPGRTLALGLFFPALVAFAQSESSLSSTVVVATRGPQAPSEVVADVTVLDRADIERRGATSLLQVLAELPGIGVVDGDRVYIRGADSRMTALYIDGIRVESQDGVTLLGGGAPWDLVPLQQIERIEVLRGPASAIYGSDAMGGVVQIFTARGEKGFQSSASVGLGSQATRRAAASLRGAAGDWDYAISLSRHISQGYDTRPELTHPPGKEGFQQTAGHLKLGYQLSANQRFEFSSLNSDRVAAYVGLNPLTWDPTEYRSFSRLSAQALNWSANWSDTYRTRVAVTQSVVDRQDDVPFDFATRTRGVLVDNRWRIRGGEVSLLLEERQDDLASYKDDPYLLTPPSQAKRSQTGLAAGYGRSWGAHSLQLNLRTDRNSDYGSHTTGGAAYAYKWSPHWKVTASAANAFRAPTVDQTFGPYGSRSLQSETNHNVDLGVAYQDGFDQFKVVAFDNRFSNLISSSQALTSCAAQGFCYYNVGRAQVRGVTLSGASRISGFDVQGSFDVLDPKDLTTGRQLSLRPRQRAFFAASRQVGQWRLGAQVRATSTYYTDARNTATLPGNAIWSATASHALSPDWTLAVRLDNLTDRTYRQDLLTQPGRTVFANLTWRPAR